MPPELSHATAEGLTADLNVSFLDVISPGSRVDTSVDKLDTVHATFCHRLWRNSERYFLCGATRSELMNSTWVNTNEQTGKCVTHDLYYAHLHGPLLIILDSDEEQHCRYWASWVSQGVSWHGSMFIYFQPNKGGQRVLSNNQKAIELTK